MAKEAAAQKILHLSYQYNGINGSDIVFLYLISDLELAAEIGKNLLERNKELEVMLKSSHQYLEEQSIKNEVCMN